MAKSKTQEYIDELKTFVKHRNDGAFDPWLMPILRATAMNMVILDKLQDELEKGNMTDITDGSMGQQKIQVNPLLDKYDIDARLDWKEYLSALSQYFETMHY